MKMRDSIKVLAAAIAASMLLAGCASTGGDEYVPWWKDAQSVQPG